MNMLLPGFRIAEYSRPARHGHWDISETDARRRGQQSFLKAVQHISRDRCPTNATILVQELFYSVLLASIAAH